MLLSFSEKLGHKDRVTNLVERTTKENIAGSTVKYITVGTISTVYGVKGWVKVCSYTRPMENILTYTHWTIRRNGHIETIEIDQGRRHGNGLVAHIVGCDNREFARNYCNVEIIIDANELPVADDDEVYWHQLEGLNVYSRNQAGDNILLGKVRYLMETGANDVMVISPSKGSVDKRERLIPWLINQIVLEVNPDKGFIRVNWDSEF